MKIEIYGFPRSGNHYTASLIARNYLGTDYYLNILKNHRVPHISHIRNDVKYIYVKRLFKDVASSIFNLKERWGLDAKNYNDFYFKTCKELFNPRMRPDIKYDLLSKTGNEVMKQIDDCGQRISTLFSHIDCSLQDHYLEFNRKWEYLTYKFPNVLNVQYEFLREDFDSEMDKISTFLGFKPKEYCNIKNKVGWFK